MVVKNGFLNRHTSIINSANDLLFIYRESIYEDEVHDHLVDI